MTVNIVFILCAVVSLFCTYALSRGYRRTHNRLLLWCAITFGFLAANNIFLCIDLILFPNVDLAGPVWRHGLNALAGSILLVGMIVELA